MVRKATSVVAMMLCFALAACGGAQQGVTDTVEVEVEEEVSDPAEKFVGEWDIAAMISADTVFAGDLKAMAQDETGLPNFVFHEDGTCTSRMNGEPAEMSMHYTWELVADDTVELTSTEAFEEGEEPTVLVGTYVDDAIEVIHKGDDADAESTTTLLLTRDGTTERYVGYDAATAEPVKDPADLVGTWEYSAFVYGNEATMYSDAPGFSASVTEDGASPDTTATFNEDGTATILGSEAVWQETDDGITFTVEIEHNYHVEMTGRLLTQHDALLIDWSGMTSMDGGAYFAMTR